jgi:hypothetical protein
MKRMAKWCAGVMLATAPLVFGQDPQLSPQFPEDALATHQLVAWYRFQKPPYTPQPLRPSDTPLPETDQKSQKHIPYVEATDRNQFNSNSQD